jgi:hypothetical protein
MTTQSKLQIAYREFFNAMLGEYGVKSPGALGDRKSEFFKKIKKEWPVAKKKIQEGVLRQTVRSIIAEVLDEGKPIPDHFKKLAQVIVDKKGNFSANDFKKLNIPFEVFLQMAQMDNNILVKNAEKVLAKESKVNEAVDPILEVTHNPISGTGAGVTYKLDKKKYVLTKDIKNVESGDYVNIVIPKGTIIYNLPGGVFAQHKSLERYKLKYNSKWGLQVKQTKDVMYDIEKNSRVKESKVNEAEESKQITITDKSGNKLSATKTMTYKQFWAYEKKMKNKMSTSSGKTEISSINVDWKKGEINIK